MTQKTLLQMLADARRRLHAKGFNLWGVTSTDSFDASQCRGSRVSDQSENCCSIVVIGSGGRGLWDKLERLGRVPSNGVAHPIDDFSREMIEAEAELLREAGHSVCTLFPFDRRPVNFLRLAEAAGIGRISPVVPFLLSPEYGPWLSLRGALILDAKLPATVELDFDPCGDCAAPCLTACPVDTYGESGEVRLGNCATHRDRGGCETGCDVRRACPVGSEHRYSEEEEGFRHAASLPSLRRWFGLGLWKMVPARIRRALA